MSINEVKTTSTAILSSSLTGELMRFRQHLEAEAGEPIYALETDAALLLSDLCQFFKLNPEQRERVLGREALSYIAATLEGEVSTTAQSLRLSSFMDKITQGNAQHT